MMLREADKVEITILVDNYSDLFLPDTYMVERMKILPPDAHMSESE